MKTKTQFIGAVGDYNEYWELLRQAQRLSDALKYALRCEECLGLAANPTAIQKYREALTEWRKSK